MPVQIATHAAPLSLLLVHEQHLQPMGCDARLLALIRALVGAGQTVSLFFRAHTPEPRRSPPTHELATLLRVPHGYDTAALRGDVRTLPPPAIYERTTSAQLGRLFAQGWFNAVLVFFWFWHDPKPNVAELLLPQLHAFSPPSQRPVVAILSDDAHALRDSRLAAWEQHPALSLNYSSRALQHIERQRQIYPLADMLLHLTQADSDAERPLFPSVQRWGLLRLSLHDIEKELSPTIAAANAAHSSRSSAAAQEKVLRIGFLGNGQTPTNHLAIQWFLQECWAAIRHRHAGLRLRLIGLPPGHRINADGSTRSCDSRVDLHCGWAWGTPFLGQEAEHGVDSLGFLSQEAMVHEILSWRSMVVPVLHTTGINTKVYTALALGVPLIITPAAAAPFEFPRNSTVAFVAADAQGFEAAVDQVVSSDETWRQLSRASREHWASLLRDDRADSDVRELVSELRACLSRDGFMRKAKLSPVTFSWAVEGSTASVDLAGVVTQKRNTSLLNCFARERNVTQPSGERGSEDRENYARAATARGTPFLPLMIGVHASSGGNSSFSYTKRLVSAVWRTVCGACDLECYLPNSAASHLSVPRGTQLVVANLARHHVLDVDGVGLEQRIQAQTNRSVLPSNQSLLPRVLQWMHFVVEVGEQLQELPQPELASALRSASSQSASDESLGASATRMMLPTDPKSTLMPPRITSVCQEHSIWRSAFRFAGFRNDALYHLFSRLAKELPSLFRCNRNATAAFPNSTQSRSIYRRQAMDACLPLSKCSDASWSRSLRPVASPSSGSIRI